MSRKLSIGRSQLLLQRSRLMNRVGREERYSKYIFPIADACYIVVR
jgi:hypothetical protein